MKEIEILEKRRPREKHFLQKNGEIIAKIYSEDVHFFKNGKYEEIDNTLIEDEEGYTNKQNSYKVHFNKNTDKGIMKMETSGYYLDIKLKEEKIVKLSKNKKLNKFIEEVRYNDIIDNIDLEYKVLPNRVKEAIIIKNRNNIPEKLEFIIDTNLTLILNLDKSISAVRDGKVYFNIEAPYMIDTSGKTNKNIYYNLLKDGEKYRLNLILDTNWLANQDVLYPIMIDPTITNHVQENNVYDTYIYPGDTDFDRNTQDKLKVGVEKVDGVDVINRALLKFELPSLGTGSQILSAVVNLFGYPLEDVSYQNWLLEVHEITEEWNESTANWSDLNDKYNSRIETLFYSRRSSVDSNNVLDPQIMQVNITTLVRKWYTNKINNGIMIKLASEEYTGDIIPIFFSKSNTVSGYNPKPVLTIRYYNQNGLENYMNYYKQNFKQGNTYVNNYNGNLTGIFNIIKTKKPVLPAKLNLIYNTNDVVLGKNFGYGLGYKFDLYQTIKESTIDNVKYLEFNDEDGTVHYFYQDGETFKDEDGINYTISKLENMYVLENNTGLKFEFSIKNELGYLSKIYDSENNSITILYNSDELISKIIDSGNNEISVLYNDNSISISDSFETVILNYNENKLLNIVKKSGTTNFEYNSNNVISRITDENGLGIGYDYYEVIPYRIKKVTEYGLNNSLGKSANMSYGFDSTTLVDNKNNTNTFVFNSNGNIASLALLKSRNDIKDAYGLRKTYGENSNTLNKITSNGIMVGHIKNYLSNISFENDEIYFVQNDNVELSISNECAVNGVRSLKIINSQINQVIYQGVTVPKGEKYTFSAYIKNTNKIKLSMCYTNSLNEEIEVIGKTIKSSDVFNRHDITIDYPEDAISVLKIKILLEEIGTLYVDDIQLEEGEVANSFNLIENSDFSKGLLDWNYNKDNSSMCQIVDIEGTSALKITMLPNVPFTFGKILNLIGKAGDLYNISFWYKCNGIDKSDDFTYNNITVNFIENSGYGYCAFQSGNFNTNSEEWQFFSYNFVAVDDYTGLEFDFLQNMSANELYITNITLIKDLREGHYSYDENGNIINLTSLDKENTTFIYDKNNQLLSMVKPRGNKFTYEYDNEIKDRLINSLTSSGISNELLYDENGNPTVSKTKKVSNFTDELSGLYKLRMKGTNDYVKYIGNNLVIDKDDSCNNVWVFEKEGDYYKIKHPILQERYLNVLSIEVSLGSYQWDNSLYSLIKQDDNSYLIKCKTTDVYLINYFGSLYCDASPSEQVDDRYKFYLETAENVDFIEVSAKYSSDGKFIQEITDSLFGVNKYDYDDSTGLIKTITNSKGIVTNYEYNYRNQIISISQKDKIINIEYDEQGELKSIELGAKKYNFTYDDFLKIKSITIGNNIKLIDNEYENNNGNISKVTYGNSNSINYIYDELDRIMTINKMNDLYVFKYNKNGNLVKIDSNENEIKFVYDIAQRISEYNFDNFKIKYGYDKNNNISSKMYSLDDVENSIESSFNENDSVLVSAFENNIVTYNYDDLDRVTNKIINSDLKTCYKYVNNGKRTSILIKELETIAGVYNYRYDTMKNITHIFLDNKLINKYEYDEYNQLIKEKDYQNNVTTCYSYDEYGNILCKKMYELNTYNLLNENKFEYNDVYWKDKLTKVNNDNITYDEIGNPLTMGNDVVLSWINGKELNTYTNSNGVTRYKYNKDGLRIGKVTNNIETKYYLEDDKIVYEKRNDDVIYYMHTCEGDLIGFKYNNIPYFYLKNSQNDVIGITDIENNIVAKYYYDAYGNILAIEDAYGNKIDSSSENVANINPFRYRSYYYDKESEFYYINSRYYNPKWCRFINIDRYMQINSNFICYNLFAYAVNNPVNYYDKNGNSFKKIWNWCKKKYEKVKKEVSETINYLKNGFTAEVGVGIGLSSGAMGNQVGAYKDINWGINEGETYESTVTSVGAVFEYSDNEYGIGYSLEHKEHDWRAGNDVEHTNPMAMPWDLWDCEDATHSITFGREMKKITNNTEITNPKENFIGIDYEFHFVVGGHIKIGFNYDLW